MHIAPNSSPVILSERCNIRYASLFISNLQIIRHFCGISFGILEVRIRQIAKRDYLSRFQFHLFFINSTAQLQEIFE